MNLENAGLYSMGLVSYTPSNEIKKTQNRKKT
jgi:hypothetical protein